MWKNYNTDVCFENDGLGFLCIARAEYLMAALSYRDINEKAKIRQKIDRESVGDCHCLISNLQRECKDRHSFIFLI